MVKTVVEEAIKITITLDAPVTDIGMGEEPVLSAKENETTKTSRTKLADLHYERYEFPRISLIAEVHR